MKECSDARKEKAKSLRYKKPILKELNLDYIKERLWEMQEECDTVRWFTDDTKSTMLDELIGDEDESHEFKMMFADLCAECDQMQQDLEEEWVPDCFDTLFCAISEPNKYGGFLGWDEYEQDYMGISNYTDHWIQTEQAQKIKRMTKDQLIEATRQCMRVFTAFVGLENRYSHLKASMDVIKSENASLLKAIKRIDELYAQAQEEYSDWGRYSKEWRCLTEALPQEAWVQ